MRPSTPTPQCLQPSCPRSKFPPAYRACPTNIPSKTLSPNWWFLDWSLEVIGWYSTSAPHGKIGPLNGSPKRLSYGVFPSDKRSVTFRRKQLHSMEPSHHFSSRPDWNSTADVSSKFCALLFPQSHLFPICVVLTQYDSRKDLHMLCRIPRNCQCKWL